MSRIGKMPISIPAGVDVTINDNVVTVKGPKGTLTREFSSSMIIEKGDGVITVSRPNDLKVNKSLHGLTRTLIFNMVEGVTNGYAKTLEIEGVGYRAAKQGKTGGVYDVLTNIKNNENYMFIALVTAFVLNYAAYFAEIFRGGIEAIPKGQYEAASMLGMTKMQTFFRIILPHRMR